MPYGIYFLKLKGYPWKKWGQYSTTNRQFFSYHAAGTNGNGNGGSSSSLSIHSSSNYGSTQERRLSNAEFVTDSVQTAASMARNPATMRPELDDNIIAGASSTAHLSSGPSSSIKPVKSDGTSIASIDGSANASDAIIQEIEPPAFEDILMFKVKEQSRPFFR